MRHPRPPPLQLPTQQFLQLRQQHPQRLFLLIQPLHLPIHQSLLLRLLLHQRTRSQHLLQQILQSRHLPRLSLQLYQDCLLLNQPLESQLPHLSQRLHQLHQLNHQLQPLLHLSSQQVSCHRLLQQILLRLLHPQQESRQPDPRLYLLHLRLNQPSRLRHLPSQVLLQVWDLQLFQPLPLPLVHHQQILLLQHLLHPSLQV
mmetsp:Transcript_722/g.894  ORF Transcript_722/g.894 Transcript_722/m.894 type:complete len:201 (-) Transcript_722:435-1037(-)